MIICLTKYKQLQNKKNTMFKTIYFKTYDFSQISDKHKDLRLLQKCLLKF